MIRRYTTTAAMTAYGFFGENSLFLVHYAMRVLRVILLLSIWQMILTGRGPVSGMTLGSVLTYTLISEVLSEPLSGRTGMTNDLWDGGVAMRLLRPMPIFGQYIAETIGGWAVSFCLFSVPLFLAAPLLGVHALPANLACAAWFVPSLALALAVGWAFDLIFGSLVVYFGTGHYSINRMREAIAVLLSGALLPLAMFPWGIGRIFDLLPFASMASAPLRIYTGTGDAPQLVIVQALWALVLWPAASRLWRTQRERIVTYGG